MRHLPINQKSLRPRSIPFIVQWLWQRVTGLVTARLRLLPDFIILGGQRCGTTSLFEYLSRHPQVRPSFPKEIHYFSNHYHRGMRWYRSHFPLAGRDLAGIKRRITGEATPYYLLHPLASERLAHDLPNARLIVLLRNPVDRAYSHYQHEVRSGVETLSFENAVREEEARIHGEKERIIANGEYRSFNLQHYTYLRRGVYFDQLRQWHEYFDQDQLLIMISENFSADPATNLDQTARFLGIEQWQFPRLAKYHHSPYSPMEPETRAYLVDYFKPHNQRLYDYLGLKLDWDQ
jgi:hypothetical protein